MKRRRARIAGSATVAAAALLAGAVAVPSALADGAEASGHQGGRAEAKGVALAAARAAKTGVDWAECPKEWGLEAPIECGTVTVPVDYAKPDGRTIEIAVDRVGNTGGDEKRQGSLVYNPGGPGGSGMLFPARIPDGNELWAKAAEAYDFVGFDPRGVGHSAPLSCQDGQEFVKAPKPDPVPDTEADKRAHRKRAKEYAHGCAERNGPLLHQMTTPNTARDLDVLRAALGEKKLNYLGVSYGTYLGGVYATLFPEHVRRMVLDSIVNPSRDKIWYGVNNDQNVAFQTRWDDWKDWVAEHDDAYGIGTTAAEVQREWAKLRAQAKKEPIGGVVGPEELLGFFQSAPYYDTAWAEVAAVWSAYRGGDEEALVEAAGPDMSDVEGNAADENGNAVYNAIECSDAKWPADWRTWNRDSERLHRDHPFLTWSNTWMNLPCATWPTKQRQAIEVGSHKLPDTLLVSSTRDAATPYPGAVELHKRLGGSRLITEKDAGSHGVTNTVNPCINARVDTYLLTGRVDRKDVTCGPHATPRPETSEAKAKAHAEAAQSPALP